MIFTSPYQLGEYHHAVYSHTTLNAIQYYINTYVPVSGSYEFTFSEFLSGKQEAGVEYPRGPDAFTIF